MPTSGILTGPPVKSNLWRLSAIPHPADMIILLDGQEWNPQNPSKLSSLTGAFRISGARHGIFDPKNPFNTGSTNVLCLDGHAESVPEPTSRPSPRTGSFRSARLTSR